MSKNMRIIMFILGFMCLLLAAIFLGLSLWIIPHAVFDFQYSIPAFIIQGAGNLHVRYDIPASLAYLIILLPLFIAGLLFLVLTRIIARMLQKSKARVDSSLQDPFYAIYSRQEERTRLIYKSRVHPLVVILSLIVLVISLVLLAEYLIIYVDFDGIF